MNAPTIKLFQLNNETEPFISQKPTITIGRAQDNDLIISESSISNYHARIEVETFTEDDIYLFFINDLHSKNGTRVNNTPTSYNEIKDGDLIIIGAQEFKFTISNGRYPSSKTEYLKEAC